MILPIEFQEKMKALLGDEYEEFLKSYEKERALGLRLNPLKVKETGFQKECPFTLEKIPWVREGFFYDSKDRPGKHPWHEAGVYYIQEPSAMAVAELLDPQPGDKVLDLCAAPGGKTTHIAGRLKGAGFLLSNEIHPARARILARNVERMGIANGVVTNENPGRLAGYFPEFFDKIVVDAPCSGEGMFRKDEAAGKEWSPDHVILCAIRQQEILNHAAAMLKPGGRLIYSTCTFSPEENEGSVQAFLQSHPEFCIEKPENRLGFSYGNPHWITDGLEELKNTVRIWPHRTDGEGHYMAVLKKEEKPEGDCLKKKRKYPKYVKDKKLLDCFAKFAGEALKNKAFHTDHLILFGEQLYQLPKELPEFDGLKVMRPGLHLGTVKKNRFEPSHALALALKKEEVTKWYEFSHTSGSAHRYLKGEALNIEEEGAESFAKEKGWVLVLVDGYSLGWAKLSGEILKNHYPKGLRWLG